MSNSQFVPGNTGKSTLGFAPFKIVTEDFLFSRASFQELCRERAKSSKLLFSEEETGGNTFDNGSSHVFSKSSKSKAKEGIPGITTCIALSSVVEPIMYTVCSAKPAAIKSTGDTPPFASTSTLPKAGKKRESKEEVWPPNASKVGVGKVSVKITPILLPKDIFVKASAIPPAPTG